MVKKRISIFVGLIPAHTAYEELFSYFSQFGEIAVLKLKEPKRKKEFKTAALRMKSMNAFLGVIEVKQHIFKGVKLRVEKKFDIEDLLRFGENANGKKVYVLNVPLGYDQEQVKIVFERIGPVLEVKLNMRRNITEEKKNYCFITFEKEETARIVQNLGAIPLVRGSTHMLFIEPFVEKDSKKRRKLKKQIKNLQDAPQSHLHQHKKASTFKYAQKTEPYLANLEIKNIAKTAAFKTQQILSAQRSAHPQSFGVINYPNQGEHNPSGMGEELSKGLAWQLFSPIQNKVQKQGVTTATTLRFHDDLEDIRLITLILNTLKKNCSNHVPQNLRFQKRILPKN